MPDPFDALRLPITPQAPDAAFAAALRDRLIDALLTPEEIPMTTTTAAPRNGLRSGDLSYLTVGVRDAARFRAFYGALLGWTFDSPDPAPRSQVRGVRPEMGIHTTADPGTVLAYRVDDIAAAVAVVRAAGGTSSQVVPRPYALEAECTDDQGTRFYLHEFADGPVTPVAAHHGDVAYVTLGVPDVEAAERFYGAVLGWTFAPGSVPQGRQVRDVLPPAGIWGGGSGAVLTYRVDDVRAAVEQVRALGGSAGEVTERPYGTGADGCTDDQGAEFGLLQVGV